MSPGPQIIIQFAEKPVFSSVSRNKPLDTLSRFRNEVINYTKCLFKTNIWRKPEIPHR